MGKHLYKFGLWCLDSEERVLRRGDVPVALPPKDLETLLVLVERAGHIVDKEELLEKVWPGVFIEEGNLSRRIFNLRQVLGDGTDGQRYIETIPRRGYRFVASLQEDQGLAPATSNAANIPEPEQSARGSSRRKAVWAGTLVVAILLAVFGGLALRRASIAGHASSQKVMLAVLPFT